MIIFKNKNTKITFSINLNTKVKTYIPNYGDATFNHITLLGVLNIKENPMMNKMNSTYFKILGLSFGYHKK